MNDANRDKSLHGDPATDPSPRLAYLFPSFPVFHQTFVLWEVLGIRRCGADPKLYSLRPPSERQQPEGRAIIPEVVYLPGLISPELWHDNLRFLRRAPTRWLHAFAAVVRAWRTGVIRHRKTPGGSRVTWYNRLRGWYHMNPFGYLAKSLALVPIAVHLAERLRRDGITHLHVHWITYPATVAYVVHELTGLPFSISAHAYDIYMIQRMVPEKIRAARFVVTCAKTNATFLRELTPDDGGRILVSYHGVDVDRFAPVSTDGRCSSAFRIVSCGQLERYKGMHLLVDACAALSREGVDTECWIAGDGPERGSLTEQIQALGLSGKVHLTGAIPQEEFAELLRAADVFVLASELAGRSRRRDVIANVIVEAMAAGVPVIASLIPGIEELVDDGLTGYLFTPNRTDELTAAVRRLAQSPERRSQFATAARQRVLDEFDSSKNVCRLAELLREAAASRTC